MKLRILTYTTAILSIAAFTTPSYAETVTTKTYVQNKELKDIKEVNFSAFDVNHDGQYSMIEVGEQLFKNFDMDGNQLIDNLEWDRKSVMTIIPMEKETYKFVDENDDGIAEESTYTYETFIQTSGLMKFDENYDGLSASEFIGEGFQSLDDNDDNMIDLEEWKEAYIESRAAENAQQELYNE